MKFTFAHYNFNVVSIARSVEFYQKALGLHVSRTKTPEDKSFELVFLKDDNCDFELELTELKDHPEAYDLGESEFHLAFVTDKYEESYALHKEMGIICFENKMMGIYFIEDPDGYWIEIVPDRKSDH